MIRTSRYFINVDDGSVVAWTSEIEQNYKFKEITVKIAMAIEHGKISWEEVVRQIVTQINPKSLDEMIDDKTKLNVRGADLKLVEQALQDGTQQSGEGTPFDIDVPENATEEEKKSARETAAKKRAEAKAAKDAEAKAAEEKARKDEELAAAALAEAGDASGTEDMPADGPGVKDVNL